MTRTLIGVGVGPGDPELVTVKAVRCLQQADLVLVPVMDLADQGRAEATVRAHIAHDRLRRVVFALNEREDTARREQAWDNAAAIAVEAFSAGARTIAFATIGDPNIYSTFGYLAATVVDRLPEVEVETIPGITAMQALAATSGTVLCEGTESLLLVPMTAGISAFEVGLQVADTVVAYKGGRHLPEMIEVLQRQNRLPAAVFGAALGLEQEDVRPVADVVGPAAYLSTVIAPPARTQRGGRL